MADPVRHSDLSSLIKYPARHSSTDQLVLLADSKILQEGGVELEAVEVILRDAGTIQETRISPTQAETLQG